MGQVPFSCVANQDVMQRMWKECAQERVAEPVWLVISSQQMEHEQSVEDIFDLQGLCKRRLLVGWGGDFVLWRGQVSIFIRG